MPEIPFSRPSIGRDEINAVAAVLESGWLTTGAQALAFEEEFARFVEVPYALAVNSATAGLHLALEACGVGPDSAVIVPSLTFTATAEVARYLGAEVVFADISPDSLLMDAADVERRAESIIRSGKRLGAIVPVHLAGMVCEITPLRTIARRHGAVVIEDAAHAFPSHTAEGYAGTIADAGVFSFYANKTITTGEGGMVCTADGTIAHRVRTMRTHGIDREAWNRYRNTRGGWYYQVVAPGYKYNMPDTAAAIGRVQLRRADSFHADRRERVEYYRTILHALEIDGALELPPDQEGHAWHLFIVRLNQHFDRDAVIEYLNNEGIGTSVHYIPLHRMPYWAQRYRITDADLPATAGVADRLISLPLFPALEHAQQDRVAATLSAALREEQ